MQDLKVTLVQTKQFWEDKSKNWEHFGSILNSVEYTDLVLLPEMFNTSFSMNAIELAEEFESSSSIQWLKEKAIQLNFAIFTSLIIKENGKFYNRGVFVYPNGEIKIYDKRKLFSLAKEDLHFSPGNNAQIVNYLGWNINLQICFDLRFPEISRNSWGSDEKPNYDLCLYVANWPKKRARHWKSLVVSRAIENQSFLVAVNRVGEDGMGHEYSGDSAAINPQGLQINDFNSGHEAIQTVILSANELIEIREKMNFLKDA
jgi:predicted amidohydrolase